MLERSGNIKAKCLGAKEVHPYSILEAVLIHNRSLAIVFRNHRETAQIDILRQKKLFNMVQYREKIKTRSLRSHLLRKVIISNKEVTQTIEVISALYRALTLNLYHKKEKAVMVSREVRGLRRSPPTLNNVIVVEASQT